MYVILQSKIFTFEKTNVSIVFFNTIPPKKKKELAIAGKLFLFLCSSAFANVDERGLLSANILLKQNSFPDIMLQGFWNLPNFLYLCHIIRFDKRTIQLYH